MEGTLTPKKQKQIFHEQVTEEFILDWYALIEDAYPTALRQTYGMYSPFEAHDMVGHHRRAIIEGSLREMTRRHPGVEATPNRNKRETQNYTEVRIGSRVVLTQSALPFPNAHLRPADFRSQYARTLQYALPGIREDTVIEDDAVFAVLAHGPETDDWSKLGFAFVGFPSANFRHWIGEIDLIKEYTGKLAARKAAVMDIPDQAKPTIRRKDETGTGS